MIKQMQVKEKTASCKNVERWTIYILRCNDGTLYTGITKDIERRVKQHNDGKGSKYTQTRLPVTVVYSETKMGRANALVREAEIKHYSKEKKEQLVSTFH
ncbi:MAG: GIY-YIG nuclease family protein [Nitrospirota bacterium]